MRFQHLQRPERWPTYLAAFILVATPFVVSRTTLDPVLLPRLITLSAAVVLLGISLWLTKRNFDAPPSDLHSRTIIIALFGYLVFVALSVSSAFSLSEAVMEAAKVALLVSLVIVFAMTLQRDKKAFGVIARGLTLVACVVAIIGLAQYYQIAFDGYVRSGGFANRNLLASALCLLLPFVLYVNLQGSNLWRRLALIAIVPTLAMVMLTNSRAVWFALAVACVSLIGTWFVLTCNKQLSARQRSKWKRQATTAILVTIMTSILFSLQTFRQAEQQSVIDRTLTAPSFSQGSVAERLAMWSNSLAMFSDYPMLGVGAGNWKLISPAYGPIAERQLTDNAMFQRPHNDYLWILSESGIFALICYLTILISALVCAFRALRTSTESDDIAIAFSLMFGLILFVIISLFSYPKERIVHSMLIALMLASALTIPRTIETNKRTDRHLLNRMLVVVAIVFALPSFVMGLIRLQSESHIGATLNARDHADWPRVIQEVDLASSRWVQLDHTATPLAWYRGVANFSMNRYDIALDDFRDAMQVHPNHHHVLNNLGTCFELQGLHDSAIFYYRRSLEIAPGFEDATINLAAVYYNDGQYETALETLHTLDMPVDDTRFEDYLERIKIKLAQKQKN